MKIIMSIIGAAALVGSVILIGAASNEISGTPVVSDQPTDVQFVGRTNVHSGGHGEKRHGGGGQNNPF